MDARQRGFPFLAASSAADEAAEAAEAGAGFGSGAGAGAGAGAGGAAAAAGGGGVCSVAARPLPSPRVERLPPKVAMHYEHLRQMYRRVYRGAACSPSLVPERRPPA